MAGKKGQHYLTEDERYIMEGMLLAGAGPTEIARKMGVCRQTVYNEMKRGLYVHTCDLQDQIRYSADKAQQIHEYNQTAKGRPLKIGNDHAYADFLEKKMLGVQPNGKRDRRKRFSPSAALAAARAEGFTTSVCPSTLYSYIDKRVFLHITNKDLIEKGRTRQKTAKPERRTVHPALPSIVNRPEAANRREELGHKEIDLVVGCANTKAATLTITDRKGREEMAFLLPDKRAASVRAVFDRLERKLGKRKFREAFRSITTDNGPEFLEYDLLTQSIYGGKRFEVYGLSDCPFSIYNLPLRMGEGIPLTWEDIDLEKRTIRVNKKAIVCHDYTSHSAPQVVQDFCKTKSSKRRVIITPGLVGVLREHKAEMMKRVEQSGEEWSESRLVFPNTRGNMVHNRNLQHSLYRIFAKAGIEGATMHTLRHTYATRCFEAGVDIKAISEQLGHANVKTTYNIYVHLLEDTKEKEIDKLEGIDRLLA